jgi:thiamine pyrophosphokinase
VSGSGTGGTARRALVLANGAPPSAAFLHALVRATDALVCADGGANTALAAGLRPAAIVGDMDSIAPQTRAHYAAVPFHEDHDEFCTDLEKAVVWALAQGYGHITIAGAAGRRIDHTVGNLGVLTKFHGRATLVLVDEYGELQHVGRELPLDAPPGTVVSLLPLTRCEGIETEGLQYPLRGEVLELGGRDATSNVVVASPAIVRVARGHLLLYRLRSETIEPGVPPH